MQLLLGIGAVGGRGEGDVALVDGDVLFGGRGDAYLVVARGQMWIGVVW